MNNPYYYLISNLHISKSKKLSQKCLDLFRQILHIIFG